MKKSALLACISVLFGFSAWAQPSGAVFDWSTSKLFNASSSPKADPPVVKPIRMANFSGYIQKMGSKRIAEGWVPVESVLVCNFSGAIGVYDSSNLSSPWSIPDFSSDPCLTELNGVFVNVKTNGVIFVGTLSSGQKFKWFSSAFWLESPIQSPIPSDLMRHYASVQISTQTVDLTNLTSSMIDPVSSDMGTLAVGQTLEWIEVQVSFDDSQVNG